MGFLNSIFGSGNSSGEKEFSKVKTTTRSTDNGDSIVTRSISKLISGDDKGTHETVFSKTVTDTKSGKSTHEEGWHGSKSNK